MNNEARGLKIIIINDSSQNDNGLKSMSANIPEE